MKPTSNWLEMHARFRPEAPALVFAVPGEAPLRWTYAEMYKQSLRWTARLIREGVGAGDRVAVLCQNRPELFFLLFACAEVGAILCPMNWRLSLAELLAQLADAEPSLLLVGDGLSLDVNEAHLDDGPGEEQATGPGSSLDDVWMMLFTSGSTGRPKGALLSHGQAHWNALNTVLACDLGATDSTLTFTPLFHTGGMNCLSTPLFHRGGCVVLTPSLDVEQALDLIPEHAITLLMGVPTIFQMLADHPHFEGTDFSSVRAALVGGAPLGRPLLERYLRRDIALHQGFGMTEVGPNCFSMPVWALREKVGSVGLPIHHVAARVMRADGVEARVDEPGELQLRGPVVFSGYWRNPEATAAVLTSDGWFRTGDVLSVDADGFYTVRGRLKEMFISGGENVYPAEVEAALFDYPGVSQVAVVGVPDERWGEVGRAFVEPAEGVDIADEALRSFLDGRLARYKIPRSFVLGPLPRTASGKVDKARLARHA